MTKEVNRKALVLMLYIKDKEQFTCIVMNYFFIAKIYKYKPKVFLIGS